MDSTNTEPKAELPPTKPYDETSLNAVVEKTLSHSSSSSTGSSPDSPLVDPFTSDDEDSTDSFSSNESPIVGPVNDTGLSTEAPCSQTMERAESSAYRIPSSVFAPNPPAGDWSVASNESLFSIHASFRNESFWKSGDLGVPGHKASSSDHMFMYSAEKPSSCNEGVMSHELGLAQATMKEVIMESEMNRPDSNRQYPTKLAEASSCNSHGRSTSTKSFAFSIKAEQSQREGLSRGPSSGSAIPDELAPPSEPTAARRNSQLPAQPLTCHHDQKTDPAASSGAHPKKWSWHFFARCSLW